MTERAAAVVVVSAPPPDLEPVLGRDGCAALRQVLVRRALDWATAVGDAHLASPAGDDMAALAPAGVRVLAQEGDTPGERLAAVCSAVVEEHGGPVLLVDIHTPHLRVRVGELALEDLREDCDVTFAPSTRAGFYLIGLRAAHVEVFDVSPEAWGGPEHLARTFEAAHRAELTLGMLRAERGLRDEGDIRALLADPLAPPEIVEVLRRVM